MAEGEYESTKEIYKVSPDLISQPIGWGTYESNDNVHFFLCKFADLHDELPDIVDFCKAVADLHMKSQELSPNGKFGFQVTTCNGTHQQYNEWSSSWEEFFTNCLRKDFEVETSIHGRSEAISEMLPAILDKVCPRLLRPLETEGRVLRPALIHGDLWDGNVAVDTKTGLPHLFDPAALWAHNEYDQNNWRGARFTIGRSFRKEYLNSFPVSPPEEDWDDRNLLYSLRVDLLDSILYNQTQKFRELAIETMRQLVAKFPNGYEGQSARKGGEPVVADDTPGNEADNNAITSDGVQMEEMNSSNHPNGVAETQTESEDVKSPFLSESEKPVKSNIEKESIESIIRNQPTESSSQEPSDGNLHHGSSDNFAQMEESETQGQSAEEHTT